MIETEETNDKMTENSLTPLTSHEESIVKLLAGHEEILSMVEQAFPVKIFARGSSLLIKGEDEELIKRLENLLTQYAELALNGQKLSGAQGKVDAGCAAGRRGRG